MSAAKGSAYPASSSRAGGIPESAFIDINYESPLNNNNNSSNNNNNNNSNGMNSYPNQYPPYTQQYNAYNQSLNNIPNISNSRGPPPQQFPGMQSKIYMNPSMSMSSQSYQQYSQHHQQMYSNQIPNSSYSSQNNQKYSKQRRNSNSSINTTSTSVNNFMKKQWGKLGGINSSNKNTAKYYGGNDDKEDDEIEINTSNAEISFDDLQHIRGARVGSFGLTDSTPYIPTLKTNMNASNNKMSSEQYRKIQMANKKSKAMNLARHQQQQNNINIPPPRSMSLQSYQAGRYGDYNGYAVPQQMQFVPPTQGTQYQSQPRPPPSQQQQQQQPNMNLSFQQQSMQYHPQMQQQGAFPQGYSVPYGQQAPNPRSMSLQSNGKREYPSQISIRGQQQQQPPQQLLTKSTSSGFISQQYNHASHTEEDDLEGFKPISSQSFNKQTSKARTVNKIDFSSLADMDDSIHNNNINKVDAVIDDGVHIEVFPTIPINDKSPTKIAKADKRVSRPGIDSIVTFESFNNKDQKHKQDQMYDLKNNSTQQTVFYSATEFPINDSHGALSKREDSVELKKQLSTHNEVEDELSFSNESTQKLQPLSNLNINEISNSLEKMALKLTPTIDNGTFENNYGSYVNDENDDSIRYSTITTGSTKPLNLVSDENLVDQKKSVVKKDEIAIANEKLHNSIMSQSTISPSRSNNLIDMSLSLHSQSKGSSPLKVNNSKSPVQDLATPLSSSSLLLNSIISTPLKTRLSDADPKTPLSLSKSVTGSVFTPEQCGLLNDNTILLQELELVTTELASSVSREILLEDNLRKKKNFNEKDKEFNLDNETLTAEDFSKIDDIKVKDNGEIEVESNFKNSSQYAATVTSLAKQLNQERRKRYLVEEMLLQHQTSSDLTELQNDLLKEKCKVQELSNQINNLNETTRLHRTEKELLHVENEAYKLEIEELNRKTGNLENVLIPKLRSQIAILEDQVQILKEKQNIR